MLRYVPPYISFLKNNQNTVDTFPRTKGLKISLRHQCHQLEPAWIEGDSMEPVYKSGEVALIRSNGFDYDGAVYALSWNDSVYIKKLYREEYGFRMVSLNKDYPEKFIPYEDEPKIVGLVVGHFMPVEGV